MLGGLEDVVAAETVLSDVDGAAGRLVIRGHTLDALAGHRRFESVVRLLLGGFFPELDDGAPDDGAPDDGAPDDGAPDDGAFDDDALAAALGDARRDAFARCAPLLPALAALDV